MEAFGQLVLAGAFAGWYWTFKKPDNLPANGLSSSFYRAVRYHLGDNSKSITMYYWKLQFRIQERWLLVP